MLLSHRSRVQSITKQKAAANLGSWGPIIHLGQEGLQELAPQSGTVWRLHGWRFTQHLGGAFHAQMSAPSTCRCILLMSDLSSWPLGMMVQDARRVCVSHA